MSPYQELLQVIDPATGEPTGEHLSRAEVYAKKLWCRTTNIFVLNSLGQILCHQRSLSKEHFPGAWSTHFGGHVGKGESFKISALKEIEEEIGLAVKPFQLIPWRTSKKENARIWVRDFLTVYDGAIEDLTIQTEELQKIAWYAPEDILSMLDVNPEDNPTPWMAGTHDFRTDYQCMRAVLTAMLDAGIVGGDFKPLHKWHPPEAEETTKTLS